jgi:hypothetical protein
VIPSPPSGHVLLKIEKFSLTANNMTYAATGNQFGYWNFFPTADSVNWGNVPVMGWATLIDSKNPDISTGGRYFGR